MSCCESDMTGMMGMMSKMMEGDQLNMMMEMMPKCLGMMLQKVPKEKRTEFVLKMVTTLVEQGSAGMSDEEKNDFVAKVIETVKGQGN
jgi:hypothetical protein